MKSERLEKTIYNSLSNLFTSISMTVLSFLVRTIFIKYLGEQCLGLDGLFTNILSFLSLAELGFSTAISFSLYEPLSKKRYKDLEKLMSFYKKVYRTIGTLIFVVGIAIIPVLKYVINGYDSSYNIYLIYFLYLVNTAFSYFTSYSLTLLEADQNAYKITFLKFIINILVYGLQLIAIIFYKNFILYLIIQFIFRQIERTATHEYIKRRYVEVNFNSKEKLDKNTSNEIKKNIKGILFHKIGDYAVNGTDNILISSIVNISMTGIYYNYVSIISILKNLIASIINSATASFGNLNVTESAETKENVFNILNFVCLFLVGLCTIGIYFVVNIFITIWLGDYYTFNKITVFIICLNFYFSSILLPIDVVKNSSGLYYIDRYIPIIQAVINLAISIILGLKFGILGILLGSTFSYLFTISWSKPYIIYKKVFKSSIFKYIRKILKNILILLESSIIIFVILKYVQFNNNILNLIFTTILVTIIYGTIFVVNSFYTNEFKFLKNTVMSKLKRSES